MDEQPARKPNPAIFVIAGLAILIGLAALIFVLTRGTPETRRASKANDTQAETPINAAEATTPIGWTITSTNPKVKVALLSELPKAPATPAEDESCKDFANTPESPAARSAVAKGWLIAGENPLGPLTAVVIVSGFETSTGGFCYGKDGNVALFDGDRLVAIVYSAKGADDAPIGAFERVGAALRVEMGGLGGPLGDLTLSGRAIRFGPTAASDSVCGGRRRVPNIYDLTIAAARRKLMAAGWKPVPSTDEVEFFAAELRGKGVVEVADCAPTGLGQCEFNYAAGGDQLGVVSIGDGPEFVTGYTVECAK